MLAESRARLHRDRSATRSAAAGASEVGADFTYQTSRFRGDKNFSAGLWGLVTGREDLDGVATGRPSALSVDYPNDLWDCTSRYRRVGDGFDPSLGFVPRRGDQQLRGRLHLRSAPSGASIRQMFHEF